MTRWPRAEPPSYTCAHCGCDLDHGAWTDHCTLGCCGDTCATCDDMRTACPDAREDVRLEYATFVVKVQHGLAEEPDEEDRDVIRWMAKPPAQLAGAYNLARSIEHERAVEARRRARSEDLYDRITASNRTDFARIDRKIAELREMA